MNEQIKQIYIKNLAPKTWILLGLCGLVLLCEISPALGVEPPPLKNSKTKLGKVENSKIRGHQAGSDEIRNQDAVLNKPSPCLVTVVTVLKSEETYERSYPFDFKTEQECKKSAERHRMNFNPEMIEKATATYVWTKVK